MPDEGGKMHIVNPKIEKYIESLRPQDDPILAEMEMIAKERDFPIIGPEVGRLLAILAQATGALRVLEMGSGYGYSAYWFARAMPNEGRIICTDTDEQNRAQAMKFFHDAGLTHKIRFEVGDALAFADTLDGPFDIIFNDIDKEDYPASIDKAVPLLRKGGLFITDNALWYGKVAAPEVDDKTTQAVLAFNKKLLAHAQLDTVILPIRDGLAVATKK
jgi:predicted O-methyltransferase YrrM